MGLSASKKGTISNEWILGSGQKILFIKVFFSDAVARHFFLRNIGRCNREGACSTGWRVTAKLPWIARAKVCSRARPRPLMFSFLHLYSVFWLRVLGTEWLLRGADCWYKCECKCRIAASDSK